MSEMSPVSPRADARLVETLQEENRRLWAENAELWKQLELFQLNSNLHAASVMTLLLSWIDKVRKSRGYVEGFSSPPASRTATFINENHDPPADQTTATVTSASPPSKDTSKSSRFTSRKVGEHIQDQKHKRKVNDFDSDYTFGADKSGSGLRETTRVNLSSDTNAQAQWTNRKDVEESSSQEDMPEISLTSLVHGGQPKHGNLPRKGRDQKVVTNSGRVKSGLISESKFIMVPDTNKHKVEVRRFSIIPGVNDQNESDGGETDVTADDLSSGPDEDTPEPRGHGHVWHRSSLTGTAKIGLPMATSTPARNAPTVKMQTPEEISMRTPVSSDGGVRMRANGTIGESTSQSLKPDAPVRNFVSIGELSDSSRDDFMPRQSDERDEVLNAQDETGNIAPGTSAYLENLFNNRTEVEDKADDIVQIENILDNAGPNSRLIGEIAFQLDRRILNYIFKVGNDQPAERRRFYGYIIKNIPEIIKRESMVSGKTDTKKAIALQYRFEYVLRSLRPLGYKLETHADLGSDLVNRYGLMPIPADRKAAELFTPYRKQFLKEYLAKITPSRLFPNVLILLDCLALMASDDGKPLFLW